MAKDPKIYSTGTAMYTTSVANRELVDVTSVVTPGFFPRFLEALSHRTKEQIFSTVQYQTSTAADGVLVLHLAAGNLLLHSNRKTRVEDTSMYFEDAQLEEQ